MAVRSFGRRAPQSSHPAPPKPAEQIVQPRAAPPPQAERQEELQTSPKADRALDAMVERLHPEIVKSLDISKVGELDNEELATQLLVFLEGSSTGTAELSPMDRRKVVTRLVHDIKGLGPLEPLLLDPEISDILVNGVSSVYVERGGRLETVNVRFRDAQHLLNIAQRIAGWVGRRVDESSPMVDARLPDGSRVNIIIPPLALDGAAISIRRFVMRETSLEDMAARDVLSPAMAEFLRIGVQARINILVSGGTGAGKTTLLNTLSREIVHSERLVTIEDAAELQLQQPHVVRLETRAMSAEGTGEVTMRSLLINTLRMRPDRIIVGEVRGEEATEMLQAMNTGHPGSMCTLHANTPRDALIRLENLLLMGSGDIPLVALRRQIASSIDTVLQVERLRSGHRCVTSVTNVVGMENEIVTTEEVWRCRLSDEKPVFETSGRLPSWVGAVDAIGMRDELVAALQTGSADRRSRGLRRLRLDHAHRRLACRRLSPGGRGRHLVVAAVAGPEGAAPPNAPRHRIIRRGAGGSPGVRYERVPGRRARNLANADACVRRKAVSVARCPPRSAPSHRRRPRGRGSGVVLALVPQGVLELVDDAGDRRGGRRRELVRAVLVSRASHDTVRQSVAGDRRSDGAAGRRRRAARRGSRGRRRGFPRPRQIDPARDRRQTGCRARCRSRPGNGDAKHPHRGIHHVRRGPAPPAQIRRRGL